METDNRKCSSFRECSTTIDSFDSFAVSYVVEKQTTELIERKAKIQTLYNELKSNFDALRKECNESNIQIHLQVSDNIDKIYESDHGYELCSSVKYSLVFIQKLDVK